MTTLSRESNVIHIVLDEVSSALFSHMLTQNSSYSKLLDGFTYFPEAVTNYAYTEASLSSMLSTTMYRNDIDFTEYLDQAIDNSAFLERLTHAGFRINLHTIPLLCNRVENYDCIAIPAGTRQAETLRLFDLSLFQTLPIVGKAYIFGKGFDVLRPTLLLQGRHETSRYSMASLLFEQYVEQLTVADVPPAYILFHSLLTHGPQFLDADCKMLLSPVDPNLESRSAELECAMGLLFSLLEKLKTLQIYDNSFVLITADHGSNAIEGIHGEANLIEGVSRDHVAISEGLFLLKPIKARGKLVWSDAKVSPLDVPGTILAALELPPVDGSTDVFSL